MHMLREKQARNLFFAKKTENKLRQGQARNNHATLTLTCMLHAQCVWQSWKTELGFSQPKKSCKHTHAHVQKEKQAKNTFFQRR